MKQFCNNMGYSFAIKQPEHYGLRMSLHISQHKPELVRWLEIYRAPGQEWEGVFIQEDEIPMMIEALQLAQEEIRRSRETPVDEGIEEDYFRKMRGPNPTEIPLENRLSHIQQKQITTWVNSEEGIRSIEEGLEKARLLSKQFQDACTFKEK